MHTPFSSKCRLNGAPQLRHAKIIKAKNTSAVKTSAPRSFSCGDSKEVASLSGWQQLDGAAHSLLTIQEGLMAGVSVCGPGACMTEIGSAVHAVADRYGYDTVQK